MTNTEHERAEALFRYPTTDPGDGPAFEHRRVDVQHDPGLGFALRKPLEVELALSSVFIQGKGSFAGADPFKAFGLRSRAHPWLGVSALQLDGEVDLQAWLRWHTEHTGWSSVLERLHTGAQGTRYEVGALQTDRQGQGFVRRTIAMRSGARMVRCDAVAPLEMWPKWHDALWRALDSFTPVNPSQSTLFRGPMVMFSLPSSWVAQGRGAADGMLWTAEPRGGAAGCDLKVFVLQRTSKKVARRRRADRWREMAAVGVLGPVEAVSREELSAQVPGWLGQWKASATCDHGESVLMLAQLECGELSVDVSLVAPARGRDPLAWMSATRAFDVVVATSCPSQTPVHLEELS